MRDFDGNDLDDALRTLGQLLHDREQSYEVVAIGGGALLLLGQLIRTTKDLDVVAFVDHGELISAKPLPLHLTKAIEEVATLLQIDKKWMNAGPADLLDLGLPDGFQSRLLTNHYQGLTVHFAGRFDQICFKLYATVDQGPKSKHYSDLTHLRPTSEELFKAAAWCTTHDVSEGFSEMLKSALDSFGVTWK